MFTLLRMQRWRGVCCDVWVCGREGEGVEALQWVYREVCSDRGRGVSYSQAKTLITFLAHPWHWLWLFFTISLFFRMFSNLASVQESMFYCTRNLKELKMTCHPQGHLTNRLNDYKYHTSTFQTYILGYYYCSYGCNVYVFATSFIFAANDSFLVKCAWRQ